MPKITKAQALNLHNARMLVFARRDVIYRAAPRDDVPFSTCLDMASSDAKSGYRAATEALFALESDLINARRGYRDATGAFQPYT